MLFALGTLSDHARARVHAGLWDTFVQKEAGAMAARPGWLDELLHDDFAGM